MKVISTAAHGVLDYATAGALIMLPRLLSVPERVSTLMTGAGLVTFAYSLMTRYELGLFKRISMRMHLMLDAGSAALFVLSPVMLRHQLPQIKSLLIGIGLFEMAVVSMSESEPPRSRLDVVRENVVKTAARELARFR
jgi:hypothetical protein